MLPHSRRVLAPSHGVAMEGHYSHQLEEEKHRNNHLQHDGSLSALTDDSSYFPPSPSTVKKSPDFVVNLGRYETSMAYNMHLATIGKTSSAQLCHVGSATSKMPSPLLSDAKEKGKEQGAVKEREEKEVEGDRSLISRARTARRIGRRERRQDRQSIAMLELAECVERETHLLRKSMVDETSPLELSPAMSKDAQESIGCREERKRAQIMHQVRGRAS